MFKHFDPVREAVTKGADWLDTVYPEWLDKIKLGKLEIACPLDCILGQSFRSSFNEMNGYATFFNEASQFPDGLKWVIDHGFSGGPEYNIAWTEEILSRRVLRKQITSI